MKFETPPMNPPGRDVTPWRARPFLILTISFFVFLGLMDLIVGELTVSWTHHDWPPPGPVVGPQSDSDWNTATPQLQVNAPADLGHLQQVEYEHLHTVRWADTSHAYASITIEQAMSLMASAEANHQLNQLLPAVKPATPTDLQNQKSGEASPPKTP